MVKNMHRPAKEKSNQIISSNRFDAFFDSERYIALKNHLYNYRLRKRAVERALSDEAMTMALEVGSGISPVLTITERIVYTDLSFSAINMLRQSRQKGWYVVADAMHLPFKEGSFSHVVASEVLEHLPDDTKALQEMAAVLKRYGRLIVTIPHRRSYFANDDVYVGHHRRYEIDEISNDLETAGLHAVAVRKVLGPLEKATMMASVRCLSYIENQGCVVPSEGGIGRSKAFVSLFRWINRLYAVLARIDAAIMPRCLSSVLLIKAEKRI